MKSYLFTGGTGYIGSHCCVELYQHFKNKEDLQIILLDNLYNSSEKILKQIKEILQLEDSDQSIKFINIDIYKEQEKQISQQDQKTYLKVKQIQILQSKRFFISQHSKLQAKVQLSHQNITKITSQVIQSLGTINLIETMQKFGCEKLIFSSSATVYGSNNVSTEDNVLIPMNPYGSTKICIEYLLKDMCQAHKNLQITSLRYYNPCGAHESGKIGDQPTQYPNNLFPVIEQVLTNKRQNAFIRELLSIFGSDYDTPDGTGVRDYIHVMDLAEAHVRAYEKSQAGSGRGYSVLEVLKMYSTVIRMEIPHKVDSLIKIVDRRPGDVAILVAHPEKAKNELNWQAGRSLQLMCRDSYNFTQKNS